ncbi:hypothetical protein TPCV4_01270 [Cutibacterium avidum]|nr:hypothetical protein TPCV4_01270 [Cutibacterium avidum]
MTTTADTKTPSIPGEGQVTAVTYQRVSTKEQATTGGRDEGFSIPAQREANRRKAETLGAQVVAEFVNAGESARLAKRPELQRMLDYIATHRVTYCIVHKVDRLARNRLDDVDIRRHLINAGVQLVSATENIDETPSGMLLHGITSSIAEFYSRNLAAEVTKRMTQKVAAGGTPSQAPIGYLNIRRKDDQGREYRTVGSDPDRAPPHPVDLRHLCQRRAHRPRPPRRSHCTRIDHRPYPETPVRASRALDVLQTAAQPVLHRAGPLPRCPPPRRPRTDRRPRDLAAGPDPPGHPRYRR